VLEARGRGVLCDVRHGLGSFNFEGARKALAAGFVADTISTDIYNLNVNGPVFDLPTTMSKLMHLGLTSEDMLLRVTAAPARVVGRVPYLARSRSGAGRRRAARGGESGSSRWWTPNATRSWRDGASCVTAPSAGRQTAATA